MTAVAAHRIGRRWVAWFQTVVGVAIAGLWVMLLATSQVPEITAGEIEIWFHLVAELVTAGLLITAGWAWLRVEEGARSRSLLALGALLYTTVNSAGYYADGGQWPIVAMFLAVALATVGAALTSLRPGPDR